MLVVVGNGESGTIYDLETGKPKGHLPGTHRPKMLALSRDGRWLLSAGHDESLCVWDVPKRKLVHALYQHTNRVQAIAISPDGAWCASVTREMRVWVFDRARGTERARTNALLHGGTAMGSLAFTPDSKALVVGGEGMHHGLCVWDWQQCREPRGGVSNAQWQAMREAMLMNRPNPKLNIGVMVGIGMLADGKFLAHDSKGHVYLWDLRPGRTPKPPTPPPSPCPK